MDHISINLPGQSRYKHTSGWKGAGSTLLCHVRMVGPFSAWPHDPSIGAETGVEVGSHHDLPWKESETPVADRTKSGR